MRLNGSMPGPRAGERPIDLKRRIMRFRPDPRLDACPARTTIEAPCDAVFATHAPLIMPPVVTGLLRLHRRTACAASAELPQDDEKRNVGRDL